MNTTSANTATPVKQTKPAGLKKPQMPDKWNTTKDMVAFANKMAKEGNNLYQQSTTAMCDGLPDIDFFKDAIATARKRAKLLQELGDLEQSFLDKHDYAISDNGPDDTNNDPKIHELYQMAEDHIPELLEWEEEARESAKKRKLDK